MGQLASHMQQDGWEGRNEANRVSCSGVPSGAGRSSPEVCCSCMYMDGHGRTWTYTVERRVDAGSDYLGEGPSHARSCTRGSAGCSKVLTATARVQAKRQHGATEALFERSMAYIVDPTHSRPNGAATLFPPTLSSGFLPSTPMAGTRHISNDFVNTMNMQSS
jgi:hypothetical protein